MLSYLKQDFPLLWFVSKPSEDYFKWFTTQIEDSIEHAYGWLLYDVLVFRVIHEIYCTQCTCCHVCGCFRLATKIHILPIPSMYGIFTCIWWILMVFECRWIYHTWMLWVRSSYISIIRHNRHDVMRPSFQNPMQTLNIFVSFAFSTCHSNHSNLYHSIQLPMFAVCEGASILADGKGCYQSHLSLHHLAWKFVGGAC